MKVLNLKRGYEQDFVRQIMVQFSLANYSVNNKEPYDTVLELSKPEEAQRVATYINTSVTHIRGQLVKLEATAVSSQYIVYILLTIFRVI